MWTSRAFHTGTVRDEDALCTRHTAPPRASAGPSRQSSCSATDARRMGIASAGLKAHFNYRGAAGSQGVIYGQQSWHPQPCKATAVFCINTKTNVFPQSHPVCAIPALLPAIPPKPPSIFLFRCQEHVVMVVPLGWEWEAVKLIHQSQVRRHGWAQSTHSQHYLCDITHSDFFLGKAPN